MVCEVVSHHLAVFHGSIGDSELALDVALRNAGMLLRVDLAEDGAVEGLFRRLALGGCPQMALEDGFEDFLAVHRVFWSGRFENLDGGAEERHALDRLVRFVRGIDGVLVFFAARR